MRVALLTLTFLVACEYESGRPIDFAATNRLRPGVSTMRDAVSLLGPAGATTTLADGSRYLGWTYAHAVAYGSNGSQVLTLKFRPDGTFDSVVSASAAGEYADSGT